VVCPNKKVKRGSIQGWMSGLRVSRFARRLHLREKGCYQGVLEHERNYRAFVPLCGECFSGSRGDAAFAELDCARERIIGMQALFDGRRVKACQVRSGRSFEVEVRQPINRGFPFPNKKR